MLKLTRLNHNVVAINPDHISWADASPDTTLFLIGGEKIIVRETLEDLIEHVVRFRRLVRMTDPEAESIGSSDGDPPRIGDAVGARRASVHPSSMRPPPPRRDSGLPRGGDR